MSEQIASIANNLTIFPKDKCLRLHKLILAFFSFYFFTLHLEPEGTKPRGSRSMHINLRRVWKGGG